MADWAAQERVVKLNDDALAESDRELMRFLEHHQKHRKLLKETQDLEKKVPCSGLAYGIPVL